jgi:peptidoglycan/xylan/chitin deacetylase (PgdA/CDA1 family)
MEYARQKGLLIFLVLFVFCRGVAAEVISVLPTSEKVVALTFDACETVTPAYFDSSILDYLIKEQIPCTIFISGRFALRNQEQISSLARMDFVEIENHSMNHPQWMQKLDKAVATREVQENEQLLQKLTGRKPIFFRFPAGNYDPKTLQLVESLGYRVVHWTFPSGDPDKKVTEQKLTQWVLAKTRPGSILIFHINGRGYQTGGALPQIVTALKNKGYSFIKLENMLK